MNKSDKYERVHYITSRPFTEELQRMIDNPPDGSITLEITPAMATEMMKRNRCNRPISATTWEMWGKLMRDGKWLHTGEPIIFGKDGRLLQGQHRLLGCINYEATFTVDVVFGRDNEIFAVLDTGKKRTCADIFSISGVKNSKHVAAALLWVIGYDRGGFSKPSGGSIEYRMSNADVLKEYERHTDLQLSMWVASRFAKSRIAQPSLMMALHYICARRCRRDADDFFDIVTEGVGVLKKSDPAFMLRNKMIDNLTRQERISGRALGGLTISAWNLWRQGRSGRAISYNPEKAFPRAR